MTNHEIKYKQLLERLSTCPPEKLEEIVNEFSRRLNLSEVINESLDTIE